MTRILRLLLALNAIASCVMAAGSFVTIPGHWLAIVYREGAVAADVLLIATAGVWLTWIAKAVQRVRAADPGFVQTPAYAVAGHVVPIANLVMPYRTIVALISPSAASPLVGPGGRATQPVIVGWWTAWLTSMGLSAWAYGADSRGIDGLSLMALAIAALLAMKVITIVEQRSHA